MYSGRVVGRILIPAATIIAIDKGRELKCRPSELPIYTNDPPYEQKKVERPPPNMIEKEIGNVRRQIVSFTSEITKLQDKASELYEEVYCQAEWLIDYLQEEDNTTPKYGAIAVGGLAGFILALRGGKFRKLLFTTAGALGMAAICYPTQAAEYSELLKEETRRYLRIGYNFYHGVKKDDPPLELPSLPSLPSIPKNFGELVNLFSSSDKSDSIVGEKKAAGDEGKKSAAPTAAT